MAHDTCRPLNRTRIYAPAAKDVCCSRCIVPTAILRATEVTAGMFLRGDRNFESVEGALLPPRSCVRHEAWLQARRKRKA